MYGRDVTPNTHALAEQFVTLDHFFASGGNSADGHQWLTQANETEYPMWPLYYGRSYPSEGIDALTYSSGGFLWEAARAKGKTVTVFGEYAPAPRVSSDTRATPVARAVSRASHRLRGASRHAAEAIHHALRHSVARPRARARVSGVDAGSARRREGGRHSRTPRGVGDGANDAEPRDGDSAERSHGGNVGRLVHAQGVRRRQRPRARQDRRRALSIRRSGRTWRFSSSRTTRRTASTTSTAIAPWRSRSRPTRGVAPWTRRSTASRAW